ncbi:hypothetical protein [Croceimicrobium sp.]|uniref:hypothetical protein n=1 Tax=Croceimicrobium sp. TaxID=2828340 RepID=UPI003BAACAD0
MLRKTLLINGFLLFSSATAYGQTELRVCKYRYTLNQPLLKNKGTRIYSGTVDQFSLIRGEWQFRIYCDLGQDCYIFDPYCYSLTQDGISLQFIGDRGDTIRYSQFSFKDSLRSIDEIEQDLDRKFGYSYYLGDTIIIIEDREFDCFHFALKAEFGQREGPLYKHVDLYLRKSDLLEILRVELVRDQHGQLSLSSRLQYRRELDFEAAKREWCLEDVLENWPN